MIKDYFDNTLGSAMETSSGETHYNCPFCGETDHKLYVHTDMDSSHYGLWDCKKCKRHGNFVSFVRLYEHLTYKQAQDVALNYDMTIPEYSYNKEVTQTENLLFALAGFNADRELTPETETDKVLLPTPIPEGVKSLSYNASVPEAYPYLQYALKRGFTLEDIYRYNICYCVYGKFERPDKKPLTIRKSLVFLTYDDQGKSIYWNTRSIVKSKIKAINAPELDGHYSKRSAVFNLNQAKKCPYLIITEGVPDAVTLGQPAVATFGKAVSNQQIELITSSISQATPIILLLDMDAKNIMVELAQRISLKHPLVYIVDNPTNRDANSLGKQKIYEIVRDHNFLFNSTSKMQFLLKS